MRGTKRVAILGMGPMGLRHLQAVRLVEHVQLVALVDARPEALAAAKVDSIPTYSDANRMLADMCPDTIIVATNGPSHCALVLAAVAAGAQNILCEKPIACSIAEAEEMIRAAHERGCALAVNHSRRHVPAYAWLARRLQSGEWGQLRSILSSWPGVGLGCNATHMIDLWSFLGGETLNTVFGWVDPIRGPNPRGPEYQDPGGMVVATSALGTRYVHEQIEDGAGPRTLTIETTCAQIRVDERIGSIEVLARDASVRPGPGRPPKYDVVPLPTEASLNLDIVHLSAEILRELVEEREITCTAEHGLRSLEVIVGAHLSDRHGHGPVVLPITDADAKAIRLPIT